MTLTTVTLSTSSKISGKQTRVRTSSRMTGFNSKSLPIGSAQRAARASSNVVISATIHSMRWPSHIGLAKLLGSDLNMKRLPIICVNAWFRAQRIDFEVGRWGDWSCSDSSAVLLSEDTPTECDKISSRIRFLSHIAYLFDVHFPCADHLWRSTFGPLCQLLVCSVRQRHDRCNSNVVCSIP